MMSTTNERRMHIAVMILGIGAALFLLDQAVPAWLRILPWLLVFGYPLGRMWRARHDDRRV